MTVVVGLDENWPFPAVYPSREAVVPKRTLATTPPLKAVAKETAPSETTIEDENTRVKATRREDTSETPLDVVDV